MNRARLMYLLTAEIQVRATVRGGRLQIYHQAPDCDSASQFVDLLLLPVNI
jgi:hypothetical protein